MAKGTVNWQDPVVWQRIVAAILASGVKPNYREVAKYYGTTYDTLENRFRAIKKEAEAMQKEVDSGERGESTPTRRQSASATPRKTKTPKGKLDQVASGRVSKKSPSKKSNVKQEPVEGSSSFASHTIDTENTTPTSYEGGNEFEGLEQPMFGGMGSLGEMDGIDGMEAMGNMDVNAYNFLG